MYDNLSIVIDRPGELREDRCETLYPDEREVQVRVRYASLNREDERLLAGDVSDPYVYPVTLGQEWVAIVVDKGYNVGLQTGQNVVGNSYANRGEGDDKYERRGGVPDGAAKQNICLKEKFLYRCLPTNNIKSLTMLSPMALAECGINMVFSGSASSYGKGEEFSGAGVSPQGESGAQQGVRMPAECDGSASQGEKPAVIESALVRGVRGAGVMSLITLLERGISDITIADDVLERLDTARNLGIEGFKTIETKDLESAAKEKGGYTLIVDDGGDTEKLSDDIELAAEGGCVLCLGIWDAEMIQKARARAQSKSVKIYECRDGSDGYEQAIPRMKKYEALLEGLVTAVIPFSKAVEKLPEEMENESNVRILIDMFK